MKPKRRPFRIPMTAAIVAGKRADGKVVAHSLDFDLVAVADDEANAFKKLRLAIKTYVEYGLSNDWLDDIAFPAPQECWERFRNAGSIESMEPIKVDDDRMLVVRATTEDAYRQIACEA